MTQHPSRAFFSKGEWLTLIGMVAVVVGATLVWGPSRTFTPKQAQVAILMQITPVNLTGFETQIGWIRAGWIAVTLAVVCSSLLLLDVTQRSKASLRSIHVACAISVMVLAVLHAGLYPGIIVTAVGSLILVAGGIVRYR